MDTENRLIAVKGGRICGLGEKIKGGGEKDSWTQRSVVLARGKGSRGDRRG